MKTIQIMMTLIAGAVACASAQTDLSRLDGPASGRLWRSPLALATEQLAPSPASLGDYGEMLALDPLPAPVWYEGRGGSRIALLRLVSPGAAAYRLHFDEFHLPAGARLFLYGLDAAGAPTAAYGPYESAGPLGTGEFRSRIIAGVQAVLELHGDTQAEWPFLLKRISRIDAATLAFLREANSPDLRETEAQRTPPSGERRPCVLHGRNLECEVIDGQLVAEGDMIVGPAEPEAESGHPKPGARREASGTTEAASRWPGGVIPIMFDRSMFLLFDPVRNTGVLDPRLVPALTHWWQNLPGIFVLRSNEPNYVIFRAVPDGCSSWVGRQERPQFIDLAPDCTVGSIIHEFGHAAGLYHEHVRQDRDDFVTVLWNNILIQANGHNERHNFEIPAANARDIGDYDYGSIMHYGRFAFSANGLPTLETIPPGIAIGQRNGLSAGDIAGVKKVQCSPSVSRRSIAAPVEGGEYEVTVTAPAYCSWTVREDVNWITAGADGGTGNGRVILAVLRNALPEPRQATVTIAGQSVSVTQERRVIQDPRPR